VYVFQGTGCQALQCVKSFYNTCRRDSDNFERFLTQSEPTTYYFYVSNTLSGSSAPIKKKITVSIERNYFNMIDAANDKVIAAITSTSTPFTYREVSEPSPYLRQLPSTNLNIQAFFQTDTNAQSCRTYITFPNRTNVTRCERSAPFSVLGDRNGDYHSVPLPTGNYSVRAIPYAQPNCAGSAINGSTISNDFTINGCYVGARISSRNFTYLEELKPITTSMPCDAFIYVFVSCGFPITKTSISLIDTTSNTSIDGSTLYQVIHDNNFNYTYDILLFVNRTTASNATFTSGAVPVSIPPSPGYVMTTIINGVIQQTFPFSLKRACTRF
jgi:hypothetical protein